MEEDLPCDADVPHQGTFTWLELYLLAAIVILAIGLVDFLGGTSSLPKALLELSILIEYGPIGKADGKVSYRLFSSSTMNG